jgi:hypothetical protein
VIRGRESAVTSWADVGNSLGCGFDESEETFSNFLEQLLAESDVEFSRTSQACPAPLSELPLFVGEPKNAAERKQMAAFDKVVPHLIMQPATVDELADELGLPKKLVRVAVERLRARQHIISSPSGLVFLTVGNRSASRS